jgi:hypothetical protein
VIHEVLQQLKTLTDKSSGQWSLERTDSLEGSGEIQYDIRADDSEVVAQCCEGFHDSNPMRAKFDAESIVALHNNSPALIAIAQAAKRLSDESRADFGDEEPGCNCARCGLISALALLGATP